MSRTEMALQAGKIEFYSMGTHQSETQNRTRLKEPMPG